MNNFEYKGYKYKEEDVEDLDGFYRYYHYVTTPIGKLVGIDHCNARPLPESKFQEVVESLIENEQETSSL
jgi:hypothetical protein